MYIRTSLSAGMPRMNKTVLSAPRAAPPSTLATACVTCPA